MRTWADAEINWDRYTGTEVSDIVDAFSGISTELKKNIENNSILEVSKNDDEKIVKFFDYGETFKGTIAPREGTDKNWLSRTLDMPKVYAEKNINFRTSIGLGIGLQKDLTPEEVVSLLSNGSVLIGMCYSTCSSSSEISRKFISREDTRLICAKAQGSGNNVKIAFFPGNPLSKDYIFYSGSVLFDKNGQFKGLQTGTLLVKSKAGAGTGTGIGGGNDDGYDVLKGEFQGKIIKGEANNEFFQYVPDGVSVTLLSSGVDKLKIGLSGYSTGDFSFNLETRKPVVWPITAPNGITFLNWSLGAEKVDKTKDEYKLTEDKDSTCINWFYTLFTGVNSRLGAESVNTLFDAASRPSNSVTTSERALEFHEKIGYSETKNETIKNCKLLKLKCKVDNSGVFCIIEIITSSHGIPRVVKIYKFYPGGKPQDNADTIDGVVKGQIIKEGIFISYDSGNTSPIGSIGSIGSIIIFQQNTKQDLYGMEYVLDNSSGVPVVVSVKQLMARETGEMLEKTYEKKKLEIKKGKKNGAETFDVPKLTGKCSLLDGATKRTFESALTAASACYNFFLSPDGLVGVFLSQLPKIVSKTKGVDFNDICGLMDTRVRQVENIVKNALGKAVTIVVDSEKTKLSEYDIMSKRFSGLDDRIAAVASVQLSSSDRPKPPLPTPTPYSIVRFRKNDEENLDANYKVGMYVTNQDILPPPGDGVIYFDSGKGAYTKVTDIRSYHMQKIKEEVVPGIGVFVVYGNMGEVSSLRPGVITKVIEGTDGTEGTDGEKNPTEIKYLPNILNPSNIETFTNGNGGEDNLLMSSTKSMSSSQKSSDKTWLCIPPEMLPPNVANVLTELTEDVGAKPAQQFPDSTAAAASQPQTGQKIPVTFNWTGGGTQVYLVGSFTEWKKNKIEMTTNTKNEIFTTIVELAPDTYEYKFIVDGDWKVDSSKPKNGSGENENNVITVTAPVLEVGGIATVNNYTTGVLSSIFNGKTVFLKSTTDDGTFVVTGKGGATTTISENNLTPLMSKDEVEARLVANGSKDVNSLLTGGRGRGRIRGTRKYQNQKRRGNGNGNGNGNMRRRITRKVKVSRRVVHRGGGGRGGKIYKKTRKHVRGGRGGCGRGVGHRRTIKKYHRR
jgi:hypothetical protein